VYHDGENRARQICVVYVDKVASQQYKLHADARCCCHCVVTVKVASQQYKLQMQDPIIIV
jgi:hypothetical protein